MSGSKQAGSKRTLAVISDEVSERTLDEGIVKVVVWSGEGIGVKLELPLTDTVFSVKEEVETECGIAPSAARLFIHDKSRESELGGEETLHSLLTKQKEGDNSEKLLEMSLLVQGPLAEDVVDALSNHPSRILGNGRHGHEDEQLFSPCGVAFVPGAQGLLVVTVYQSNQIRVYDTTTGRLCAKMGTEQEESQEEGEFGCPWGVAVTADGEHVAVIEAGNERVHVLRLRVTQNSNDDSFECVLEFERFFGSIKAPKGIAIKQSVLGETILVTSTEGISEFLLNGTLIRTFGKSHLRNPIDLCVLPSGEVAVTDNDSHCVCIFAVDGSLERSFGSKGTDDGQFISANAIACDGQGGLLLLDWGSDRLQVFDAEGGHKTTRADLGIQSNTMKGMAWKGDGSIAIANGLANVGLLWSGSS
jgi:hypothetical protein